MTDEEKQKILEMMNYKDGERHNVENSNSWAIAVMALFLMVNTPNSNLEKEVAFLGGKVDTLEKMMLSRKEK